MTTTLKQEQVATILKHSLAGKTVDQIAAITGAEPNDIINALVDHGHPHEDRMREALATLTAALPAPAKPAPRPPAAHEPHKMSGLDLIAAGKKSKSRTVQAAVKKAEKALDAWKTAAKALQDALTADSESAQLRKKRDDLKAQLAAVEAELNGKLSQFETFKKQRVLPDGVTYKQIRAWAALNDVDCPVTGRVPTRVIDQYLVAHAAGGQDKVEALYEQAWPTPRPGQEG